MVIMASAEMGQSHPRQLRDAAIDLIRTFGVEPVPAPRRSEKRHG
jgi:hypothetical protein